MDIKNFPRTAYLVFAVTITMVIIAKSLGVTYFIKLQKQDAETINISGRQRMLSQRIIKQVYYQLIKGQNGVESYKEESLAKDIEDFKQGHSYLKGNNQEHSRNPKIDSLLKVAESYVMLISTQADLARRSDDVEIIKNAAIQISTAEKQYVRLMETVTQLIQQVAEEKNYRSMQISYFLAILSLFIILAELFFVIIPTFKKLKNSNQILTNKNRQLSDFAQISAHNLRAPIGNLIFLSNFYKDTDDPAEKEELFGKVEVVAEHLDETIGILVDSLRIQNQIDLKKEFLYFENVLKTTKAILAGEILKTQAVITSDFSKAPSLEYHKVYMDSIFLNLIGNAIKYKALDRKPEIHISSKKTPKGIQLKVSDNGLGIDLKRQGKKIFGLHQTFHRHTNAKGIGLFMTKNQIESLGGTIEVESEPNKGSIFIINFKTKL
ncbi:ATP-binding protein [Nonlabens marinus]|uniref:histidine kinase n=1 Tax=Nonlabens marinus S1-08 TaxID=1454201 RepID=W8VN37_9FLAO|nr:ATP-binding protein [Nonlabens marinus]BAO54199.1 sensor histidine kinase of a two component response regulator [Nonlabens marinus S1-08]